MNAHNGSAFNAPQHLLDALGKKGANLKSVDHLGQGLLHAALLNGAKAGASYLLKHDVDVNLRNIDGSAPLHYAVGNSDKSIVQLLLDKGADANAKDSRGATPLHRAVKMAKLGALETLLAHGVQIDSADNEGTTPLHLAVRGTKPLSKEESAAFDEKVEGIVEKFARNAKGSRHIAALLLERGANPNAEDMAGDTPLSLAKKQRVTDLVALFGAARK